MVVALSRLLTLSYAGAVEEWDRSWHASTAAEWTPPAAETLLDRSVFADNGIMWARWFLEGLADPDRYRRTSLKLPRLYAEVSGALAELGIPDDPDGRKVRETFTRLIWREVLRLRAVTPRPSYDQETRELLWAAAGNPARCWVCGYQFPAWVRARFIRGMRPALTLPTFVDFYRPQGLKEAELFAEVEHVGAWSRGGGEGENLRLSCGWCNRTKGALGLLNESATTATLFNHPRLGVIKRPHPFWIVRRLAMIGRCEKKGCDKTNENAELTVAPRVRSGAPTPTNLRVTCAEHDCFSLEERNVPVTSFQESVPKKLASS